ncbi:hypothetical protein ABBQ38_001800 [Trebouxia sp. C0009 RCD-2024]
MYRRLAASIGNRDYRSSRLADIATCFGGRCLHERAALFASSMHGPGGQPSGTPVLKKSVTKQPTLDAIRPGAHQTVKDTPASQGSNSDSTASGSDSKRNSPANASRVTDDASTKQFHSLRTITAISSAPTRGFTTMQSLQKAEHDASGNFALSDRHNPSRDTAAAAEAKNAEAGVASGSTRRHASDTGRPS